MLCQNCGGQIADEAKFCPLCGKPISNEAESITKDLLSGIDIKNNLTDLKNNLQEIELTDVWEFLILGVLKIPGIRVDRSKFLKEKLSKYSKQEQLNQIIHGKPSDCLKPRLIVKVAKECIEARQKTVNSWLTAVANIAIDQTPMGNVLTVLKMFKIDFSPSDFGTYYFHLIKLIQELAYLYGFQEFFDENGKPLNGTVEVLTTFIAATTDCESAKSKILPYVSQTVLKQGISENVESSVDIKLENNTLKSILPSMLLINKKSFKDNAEIISSLFQLAVFNEIIKVKKRGCGMWLGLMLLAYLCLMIFLRLLNVYYGI